jgi:hypothetical protein
MTTGREPDQEFIFCAEHGVAYFFNLQLGSKLKHNLENGLRTL